MGTHPFISYGLDIEIDTTDGSVDPASVPIRAIGLSARGFEKLYTGDERQMLRALDQQLHELAPGVIATWNGSVFDLPYLHRRSRVHGIDLDLVLVADPNALHGRGALPGGTAHRAVWGRHRHLDTYLVYGDTSPVTSLSSLLGRARRRGVIANSADLVNEALHAHAVSDARLARVLAERRGIAALRSLDRVEESELATGRATRRRRPATPAVRLGPAVAGI